MEAIKEYKKLIRDIDNDLLSLKKKSSIWSYTRIVIVIGGFSLITILSGSIEPIYLGVISIGLIVLLGVSVSIHIGVSNVIKEKQILKTINENEISVIHQKGNMYSKGYVFADNHADISNDLDLFGDNSVFNMINRASTFFGNNKIKDYLLEVPKIESIIERQGAIEELSGKLYFRQELQKELFNIDSNNDYRKLIEFVKTKSFISNSKSKFRGIFAQNTLLLLLYVVSIVFFSKFSFSIFMLMFVVNSFINIIYIKNVNKIHSQVSNNSKDLFSFYKASQLLESGIWESTLLYKLSSRNEGFSERIINLKKKLQYLDFRLNIIVGTLLNIFLLWDLRVINSLDDWKTNNKDIEDNLDVLGELEVLNSLAIMKYNNPNNCFPVVSDDDFNIETTDMYHPLINSKDVVANDYTFKGRSRIDIITGPNMSGKSTFLRSIAINMILARCGSTVFAKEFIFTPSNVLTYLHITDSVKDKVSTFRAEIIKLKYILSEIEKSDIPTFYILDEILRGTNSHSKFKGSVAIVKRLLELKSSGIVATHDVKLGELDKDFSKEVLNYSFDFIIGANEELIYDYKLKDGINTKINAEIVLKELGLVL